MKKRILSMLLVIVLVLSMVPASALAAGELDIGPVANIIAGDAPVTLTAKKGGATVTDATLTWRTEPADSDIAVVSAAGELKGLKAGEVKVIAENGEDSGEKIYKVYQPPENLRIVVAGSNNAPASTMEIGQTVKLDYAYDNRDAIQAPYIIQNWTIRKADNVNVIDTEILDITPDGTLTAKKAGKAIVRGALNGRNSTQEIEVKPLAPGEITVTASATTVRQNQNVTVSVSMADRDDLKADTYTWSVDTNSAGAVEFTPSTTDNTCTVKGKQAGSVTINVTRVMSGRQYNGSVTLMVESNDLTIKTAGNKTGILAGEELQFTAYDVNEQALDGVLWQSSDEAVARFDTARPGVLIGVSAGTVDITAIKGGYAVKKLTGFTIGQNGITIADAADSANNAITGPITIYVDQVKNLKAVDKNGKTLNVNWDVVKTTDKVSVLNGALKGLDATSEGDNAKIMASLTGYATAYLDVKVLPKSTFLRLRLDNLERPQTLAVGETRTLMAFVDQSGVPVEGVTWSIPEDTACAQLVGANKDQLKGLGAGTVEVTANKLGMEPKTVTVTVVAVDLQSVDVNGVPNEMHAGESFNLKDLSIRYTPDYATDKTLVWRSGDPDVLDVDNARGVVTAKKAGQAKLYAKFADNTEVEIASVKVLTATAIVLDKTMPVSPAEVLAGEELVLKAALKDGATGDTIRTDVIWKLAKESDGDYCRIDNGNTLDTESDLLGVRTVDLIATVNGKYDAADLHYQVKIIPRSSNVTLMIGTRKVNDKETVLNLNNDEECNAGITITAYVTPAEASQEVVWQVSDDLGIYTSYETEVSATAPHATINLKPTSYKRSGSITVKALAKDGTGECAVTTIYFEKLGSSNLKGAPTTLRGGASVDLRPYLVQDKNLDDKNVTWGVENNVLNGKKIASISKTGRLTTKAVSRPITITVTVKGSAGAPVPHDITLYPTVKTIKISSQELGSSRVVELQRRGEVRLLRFDVDITPDILEINNGWTAEMPLVWSTTDKNIAEFLDPYSGELTVKRAGKVRIDCSATDGSKVKGSLLLDVVSPAGYVTITAASEEVVSGNSMNMKAVVYTAEGRKAAKQRVIWSVADEYGGATDAALISTTGRLTAKNVRMNTVVVVTATSAEDKEVFETVEVTIKPNTSKTLHALAFDGKLDDEGKLVDGGYTMNLNESCFIKGQWQMTSTGDVFEAEDCQFFSGNDMVASVDEEHGTLSAVGYGTATITLRCVDPDTKNVHTTTFTLKVTNKVSMVTVNAPTLRDIRSGQSVYLSATAWTDKVNNVKAENQSFNWEVYDVENDEAILDKASEVASISSNGVLYAETVNSKHVVEVWAISKENNIIGKARFNIYPAASVALSFELDNEEYANILPLDIDDYVKDNTTLKTLNLKVMVYEAIADYQGNIKENPPVNARVTWSSDNKDVVEVKNNKLYVKAIGKATLTAVYYRAKGGVYSANITVVVNQTVGSIVEIQTSNIDNILVAGKTAYLRAVFENANATNKNVLWSVDGPNADLVSLNVYTGRIKVKSNIGTEAIDIHVTATPVDGSVGADEYITIHPRTTKVQILDEFDDVVTGKTIEAELSDGEVAFGASVNPDEAYADHFKWTSSNTNVAEVDEEGTVTLKKVGAVTIKATALDGTGKYAKVKLRITNINP